VHLNEPGRTEWEGFLTGTHAAAAGKKGQFSHFDVN
jgi:dihydroorotase-like cyclic amidohydrolase